MTEIRLKKEEADLPLWVWLEMLDYRLGGIDLPFFKKVSEKTGLNYSTIYSILNQYFSRKRLKDLENLPENVYVRFQDARKN